MVRWFGLVVLFVSLSVSAAERSAVEIIAHRGASHDAPENTVASFKAAWAQNADGAELDLYLTSDGKIVACHDKDMKRTAGSEMLVAKSTFEQLRALDVGEVEGDRSLRESGSRPFRRCWRRCLRGRRSMWR